MELEEVAPHVRPAECQPDRTVGTVAGQALEPRIARHSASGYPAAPPVDAANFFKMLGDEVHEVAVGPVHAGVIEPGHFRFQCHGETVYHLEISLGYQHRGVERAMIGGPDPPHHALCGDLGR